MIKKIFLSLFTILILLSGLLVLRIEITESDAVFTEQQRKELVQEYLNTMSIEEKVAQLFVILPEALIQDVSTVTAAGSKTKAAIDHFPVGGIIYMSSNLQSEQQVREMLRNTQEYSIARLGIPIFLCVDEEGGIVSRISGNEKFGIPEIENMSLVGEKRDVESAYEIGVTMGEYLSDLGFNVDFAPVADVLTNSKNEVVKLRSFGADAETVSVMAEAISNGLISNNVLSTYKHYPGHGATTGDTHEGYVYIDKTLEQLMECELVPFLRGIENDVPFIMVGHISTPNITGDCLPASLSKCMISQVLRNTMMYEGIVITDAMNMGAIAQHYSSKEAAVRSLQAGVDMILMPQDFCMAYEGVLEAVENGDLSLERIDESLARILNAKLRIMEK